MQLAQNLPLERPLLGIPKNEKWLRRKTLVIFFRFLLNFRILNHEMLSKPGSGNSFKQYGKFRMNSICDTSNGQSNSMGRAVLISIHPEYVKSIISGEKVYEYRKFLPKQEISFLVLYCTAPVRKITAVVEVRGCLVGSLADIWDRTSRGSGISHSLYSDYYSGKQSASVFILGDVYQMESPMDLSDLPSQKTAPQSFCYLDDKDMEIISERKSPRPTIASSMDFVEDIRGVDQSASPGHVSH